VLLTSTIRSEGLLLTTQGESTTKRNTVSEFEFFFISYLIVAFFRTTCAGARQADGEGGNISVHQSSMHVL
jgi:hypothetical protein